MREEHYNVRINLRRNRRWRGKVLLPRALPSGEQERILPQVQIRLASISSFFFISYVVIAIRIILINFHGIYLLIEDLGDVLSKFVICISAISFGGGLFFLKRKKLKRYAQLEIAFSIAAIWLVAEKIPNYGPMELSIAMLSSIYIFTRGLSNLMDSHKQEVQKNDSRHRQ